MPLIVSGIRLALVQVWATATIAALVAGPGLGTLITQGFYRTDYPKGIAAAFIVAVVAFVLEVGGALTERAVEPNRQGTATRAAPSGVAPPHAVET
jgi:osmoprotectant transport system permease protein